MLIFDCGNRQEFASTFSLEHGELNLCLCLQVAAFRLESDAQPRSRTLCSLGQIHVFKHACGTI